MNKYNIIMRCRKLKKTVAVTIHNRYWDTAQDKAKDHAISLFPETVEWDWEIEEMHQVKEKRKRRMF